MKKVTIFYYGEGDAAEADRLAHVERAGGQIAMTRDSAAFNGEIESCSEVVILSNVRGHHRAKIELAYSGQLIALRGSDKWYGGEVTTGGAGPEAETTVIVPDTVEVTGPKASPEDVSLAMAETNVPFVPLMPKRRGRKPKARP